MSRVLVCGGGGFIGGAILGNGRDCTLHEFHDLATEEGCRIVDGYDVVYACAGVTGGSGIINKDPLALATPNILINTQLFHACHKYGVKKVIYLSSTTGYPDTDNEMREEDYFTGDLHGAYFNPGHTRRFIERLAQMYAGKLDIVCVRPTMVYGPGDDFDLETSHVIPALVRKVAEKQDPITVWGDGANWRDAVHIDDLARALNLALDAPAGAYNIATGEGMTVMEILGTLCNHAGHSPQVLHDLTKPSMLKKRVLNIEKARNVLKWEPRITMKEGLCRLYDWYCASR